MTAPNDALFPTLARYNQWANRLLYGVCGALTEAEFADRRPAFSLDSPYGLGQLH